MTIHDHRLPKFLIVGAQKCGTTNLHFLLSQHPELFLPKKKELHFFDTFDIEKQSFDEYLSHFNQAKTDQICGESTPIYMFFPGAMEYIRSSLGVIKIIILIRNPIDRTVSQYWHSIKKGFEHLPYQAAIQRSLLTHQSEFHIRHLSYIERSCYTEQIARARRLFGYDNVHIIRFEELLLDPLATVNATLSFLSTHLEPLTTLISSNTNRARTPYSLRFHRFLNYLQNEKLGRLGSSLYLGFEVLRRLNLTTSPYAQISQENRMLTRDLLLQKDPSLTDLFPDM